MQPRPDTRRFILHTQTYDRRRQPTTIARRWETDQRIERRAEPWLLGQCGRAILLEWSRPSNQSRQVRCEECLLDLCHQLRRAERFRKNKVRVGLRSQRSGIGKTRHEQDGQAGSAKSGESGNFDPVHPGHDEIHDHQIDPIAFPAKTVQRLSPVCRLNDVVASISKHAGRGCSHVIIVIDQ